MARLGLAPCFMFLGNAKPIEKLYQKLDILVHPALEEPFGRVLLEASLHGVVPVAVAMGGPTEIIFDGQTGLLVDSGDAASFAAAVLSLLADRERFERLRRNAIRHVQTHYSPDLSARKVCDIYHQVMRDQSVYLFNGILYNSAGSGVEHCIGQLRQELAELIGSQAQLLNHPVRWCSRFTT